MFTSLPTFDLSTRTQAIYDTYTMCMIYRGKGIKRRAKVATYKVNSMAGKKILTEEKRSRSALKSVVGIGMPVPY